jgi:hypothetical protein
MDSTLLLMKSVLMHDDNHRSALGMSESTNRSDLDGSKLVVVNAGDVNYTVGCGDDTNIVTCNAAICATINQRSASRTSMVVGRDAIGAVADLRKTVILVGVTEEYREEKDNTCKQSEAWPKWRIVTRRYQRFGLNVVEDRCLPGLCYPVASHRGVAHLLPILKAP